MHRSFIFKKDYQCRPAGNCFDEHFVKNYFLFLSEDKFHHGELYCQESNLAISSSPATNNNEP
jgi:hypothetical protein